MPDDIAPTPAARGGVADAALAGLLDTQKSLPPKLFYDEEGCRLFQRITELPEYYLTRTERALLAQVAPRVAAELPARCVLVEYGASDEAKADFLLREQGRDGSPLFEAYVPIDVAGTSLRLMAERLRQTKPNLQVSPLTVDFMEMVVLPHSVSPLYRLGFFPGSTIGNLAPAAAERFLRQARATLGPDACFLVGADMRKDPAVLLPAYDDAAGVTAAFNRNLLSRLNREASADFNPDAFAHRAVWNDADSRIEMHLVSLRDQIAHVDGEEIRFTEGETIHTENSYKYTPAQFSALAAAGGWDTATTWTDAASLFSIHLLVPHR